MKAIILAGGKGERLHPLTNTIPKPMIKVAQKPVLEHVISLLKSNGITDIIITLCYHKEKIIDYFGDGKKFGIHIEYVLESQPLGTAGSIKAVEKYIKDTFLVVSGDILRKIDMKEILRQHFKTKALGTLQVYKRLGKDAKSMIYFNENKQITRFLERPKKITKEYIWSNASFYIFEPHIFKFITSNTPQDFGKDIFPALIEKNQSLFAYPTDEYFIDIGTREQLTIARKTYKP